MAKYQPGDTATFYFVINHLDGKKIIQGWTDNKDLAKFYMDFHRCKTFELKAVTKSIEEINKLCEENWNDEIKLFNILTRNRSKKKKHDDDTVMISIPGTESEFKYVREESVDFVSTNINYGLINDALPYLKPKYQKALQAILLTHIIKKVVYNQPNKVSDMIEIDQLVVLFSTFTESFGE